METEYEAGDFGEASFKYDKKGFKCGVSCHGTIKAVEKKFILFEDTGDYLYLVERSTFKFKKKVKTF